MQQMCPQHGTLLCAASNPSNIAERFRIKLQASSSLKVQEGQDSAKLLHSHRPRACRNGKGHTPVRFGSSALFTLSHYCRFHICTSPCAGMCRSGEIAALIAETSDCQPLVPFYRPLTLFLKRNTIYRKTDKVTGVRTGGCRCQICFFPSFFSLRR
ncbi:hypothetical protein BDZ97DRAFT_1040780 [Flammula alnicola]|nr:hypothetical protein BDZ97DRAFT_1040780 [Flammula alnicola]